MVDDIIDMLFRSEVEDITVKFRLNLNPTEEDLYQIIYELLETKESLRHKICDYLKELEKK